MSHFDASLIVWAKSQDSVHEPQFLKRKESRSGSNRGPSIYQHSALPLGHTGLLSFGGWGVSFINHVLKSAWSFVGWGVSFTSWNLSCRSSGGEFLLHAPCWNLSRVRHVRSLSHTPRDEICLFVRRAVGLTYKPLAGVCQVVRLLGRLCYTSGQEFFLQNPCWNLSRQSAGVQFISHAPCWNLSGCS